MENKRWPMGFYQQLMKQLLAAYPAMKIVIIGTAKESEVANKIAAVAADRCLNLAGETSLPEMVEILRMSAALVTNDTGPMHVAAALGKPVVGIFGPTDPRRTGPYGQIDRVLQRNLPCVPCISRNAPGKSRSLA